MNNYNYLIVILFVFIAVLIIAYSDWGRFPQGNRMIEDANAADRFSRQRFPETSGSNLKPLLPQDLPALEGAPVKDFDSSKQQYEAQEEYRQKLTEEQQTESDRRATRNRPDK